jgi:hypothetical protein
MGKAPLPQSRFSLHHHQRYGQLQQLVHMYMCHAALLALTLKKACTARYAPAAQCAAASVKLSYSSELSMPRSPSPVMLLLLLLLLL